MFATINEINDYYCNYKNEDFRTECKESHPLYASNADALHISSEQGYIPVASSPCFRGMHCGILPLRETRWLVPEEVQGTHSSEAQK
jgi:hypothetical protein